MSVFSRFYAEFYNPHLKFLFLLKLFWKLLSFLIHRCFADSIFFGRGDAGLDIPSFKFQACFFVRSLFCYTRESSRRGPYVSLAHNVQSCNSMNRNVTLSWNIWGYHSGDWQDFEHQRIRAFYFGIYTQNYTLSNFKILYSQYDFSQISWIHTLCVEIACQKTKG